MSDKGTYSPHLMPDGTGTVISVVIVAAIYGIWFWALYLGGQVY